MNIRKRWENMPRAQRRAGGALAGFLGVMLAFSALSRALDAFTIARVTAGAPSNGVLSHEVLLQGETDMMSEEAFPMPAGFPVRELYLREGARIEAGEAVALLDIDAIERELVQARRALEDARLAAAAAALHADTPARDESLEEAELRLERAYQDVTAAEEAGRSAIARAESNLRDAQRERRRLLDEGDYTDGEMDAVRKEISALGYAVDDAVRDLEKALRSAEREVEDAELALEQAGRKQEQDAEQVQRQEALDRQERGLASSRHQLTIAEKQAAVAELEALLETKGVVSAPKGGVVTGLRVQAGEITPTSGAFLLSGVQGMLFTAPASKEEAARLAVGDVVEIRLPGQKEPVDARLAAIRSPEKPGDPYTVTAELSNTDEIQPGMAGTLSVVKRAANETLLLPLSSLHTENSPDRGYVFVLRERSTTMGTQTVVERLDVEILDRGRTQAAVRAALASDDRIVTASSRYLAHGDRVREETTG